MKEAIHIGARSWQLSLEPELIAGDSVPNIMDIANHRPELEERFEKEVAQE